LQAGAVAGAGGVEPAPGRAAELAGARDALRAHTGVLLPPVYPAGYTRTLAATRASLTPEAFDAARARPVGQDPRQIIAMAISNGDLAGPARARAGLIGAEARR